MPPKPEPAHPKYDVMIKAAILALKERTGSSTPAIAKYLAANYTLPDNFKKMLGTLNIRKPTANEKNTQWIPPFVEAEEELHEDSPEALEKYPPLLYAMDDAKRWCMATSNHVVCAVRWALVTK